MVIELNIIEQKCLKLLNRGLMANASDIHLVPNSDMYTVFFRLHSDLIPAGKLHLDIGDRIISYFKFLSSLDISEKRKPQSGSFEQIITLKKCSFRVSTLPTIQNKESLVIRIQLHDDTRPLHELMLQPTNATVFQQLMKEKQGLICLTGPTGCGKTTTMYSLTSFSSHQLNRHIISLEDPVENNQSHLLQIQVNERSGVTYSSGLKAILRHSPDVIMIGEIRDIETARAAIQAALTGHLVLTTVHSKNPVGCLFRLMDLGVSIEELQQALVCVSSQQLVTSSWIEQDGSKVSKRSSIYEILYGEMLQLAMEKIKSGDHFIMPFHLTLQAQLAKAIELGQIQLGGFEYG
ncbi:MAG: competence type IV pilus ATPase ComGA [Paenisporosarcina sp.]